MGPMNAIEQVQKLLHRTAAPRFGFGRAEFIESWIVCQGPLLAAIGGLVV